jgi:hypothetical protein
MIAFFEQFSPIVQALLGTAFTWGVTALGAAGVFLSKEINRKLLDGMLGFAAGVMIAASYWSLLAPSIDMSISLGYPGYLPPAVGFLLGGAVLWAIDRLLPHLHMNMPTSSAEGIKTSWQRSVLFLAITMHNIPEGMAVGWRSARRRRNPGATVAGESPWHWASACRISGRAGGFGPPAPRRPLALQEFLVRPAFRIGGTHRRGDRRGRGDHYAPHPALCPGFCSRRHDLRGD